MSVAQSWQQCRTAQFSVQSHASGILITVDGELREHQSSEGHNAQAFCLVKSA